MGKKIECSLSESSFKDAAKEVRKYINEVKAKCSLFGNEMLLIGYSVSRMTIDSISPFYKGNDLSVEISESSIQGIYEGKIIISGEQVAFIEFGAGVTFNTPIGSSPHPQGQQLGMTIGSYNPNSSNASGDWWYVDNWGQSQHTYGTPAFMPLQKSIDEMISDVTTIARKVFG